MEDKQRIRLSSKALGKVSRVNVYIYTDLKRMHRDAEKFSRTPVGEFSESVGICHARYGWNGHYDLPLIRLWSQRLGTTVISHEMHHAATCLYGAHLWRNAQYPRLDVSNEEFAYLYSDLLGRLAGRLYDLGYYNPYFDSEPGV